ncbi:MAG TPA: hypothetical protein VFF60_06775 [Candidatus Binatus sp.]|nr:hypothetical protein [Candidatus Binatus sp.]
MLRFFYGLGGSLKCRVTDVRRTRSWLIAQPDELRALLARLDTNFPLREKERKNA